MVYIESSHARSIKKGLRQYLKSRDTGNTLAKNIAKLMYSKKSNELYPEELEVAVNKILKDFTIKAISDDNLEYFLIKAVSPIYKQAVIEADDD